MDQSDRSIKLQKGHAIVFPAYIVYLLPLVGWSFRKTCFLGTPCRRHPKSNCTKTIHAFIIMSCWDLQEISHSMYSSISSYWRNTFFLSQRLRKALYIGEKLNVLSKIKCLSRVFDQNSATRIASMQLEIDCWSLWGDGRLSQEIFLHLVFWQKWSKLSHECSVGDHQSMKEPQDPYDRAHHNGASTSSCLSHPLLSH